MANEVTAKTTTAVAEKKQVNIKQMLMDANSAWGKELAKFLPSPKDVARFMSCALNQLADKKVGYKLGKCTPTSFYNCIIKSARVGISPDGVNAYLIPYGDECTLQFSYRGLCDMAIRNGIATKFVADIVRKNDVFKWSNGELVEHTPLSWDEEERGDIVGVWVRAFLPDGTTLDERMSKSEVEKIRAKSQNPNGVWSEWYEEMMKKSCVKRMFKRMRNTPEMAEVIAEDNKEFGEEIAIKRSTTVTAADLLGGEAPVEPEVVDSKE